MGSSRDRLAVNLVLAVLVFVGVSGAVSTWFDDLYSEIASWTLIIGGPIAAVAGAIWWFDFDRSLTREARISWTVNGEAARALAEKHAAHPEVARDLTVRMAEEKARQGQQPGYPVTPPRTGGS